MSRKDAIMRLHHRLSLQRDALRKKLNGFNEFGDDTAGHGDLGDVANLDVEMELDSQLAALESRELIRIERALKSIREGRYGYCEVCRRPIPVARLQVLPYANCCVECQRVYEDDLMSADVREDWELVWEHDAREHDSELTINDIRLDRD